MTKKKEKPVEEKVETSEVETEKPGIDLMGMLNDPMVTKLLDSGKDLFKKEKADPNICEISIKAPSEVVLKLFGIHDNE